MASIRAPTETLDLSSYAKPGDDGTVGMDLAVEGVTCGACIARIENVIKSLPGITEARLNYTTRRLHVAWAEGQIEPDRILQALESSGYRGYPFLPRRAEQEYTAEARRLTRCLAVAGFAAMNIMLLSVSVWSGNATDITPETRDFFHWASALIALPAAAYAGRPFFASAWRSLKSRAVNMDVPISIGVILALGMSLVETIRHAEHAYFDSAIMLLFFLLIGRTLDHAMRRKTRAVAGNLAALRTETAHRFAGDELVVVPAAALAPGDRLLVRPGERFPVDGTVIGGDSEIDESVVTGETERRKVGPGATVYAGSVNYSGALTLRVTAAGGAALIDEIEKLLDRAASAKSSAIRLADRVSRIYAPLVHVAAASTLVGWLMAGSSVHDAVVTAIAVLIITCPCALALAIPAVQVVASGAFFRAGIILNSGDAVERLAEVDTIVFDKTGTLTLPEPRVVNAAAIDPGLLQMAARLALASRHPLAVALSHECSIKVPFQNVTEEPGQGIRATIDGIEARLGSATFCGLPHSVCDHPGTSRIYFAHGRDRIAILISQKLRSDAAEAVNSLMRLGLELRILSGDRAEAVEAAARALGITRWGAGLTPTAKIAEIEALKTSGRRILMVGDGVNDAPSLAVAHVSLSPISAAEITQAHADAVFLGDRLGPVVDAVRITRRARALMTQNLWLAAVYNAIAVPIAIAGAVTPLIAALAMSGSSMLVTLNALRVRRGNQ
ncbi:MAG TPA: heavy metal translocating P-type ATPase [Pseudolabrys sp.]|nr:heavy metal translocating P-type ATPase [Pseudolabrys sp.]